MEPIPPLPATPSKIHRIRLVGSKSAGSRVFVVVVVVVVVVFSSKCKTIRPGTVKGSKTDPKRDQKANAN